MSTTAVVAIAIAVFVLPGFILAWVSGVKTPAALAAGIPVTIGVAGLGAWLFGAMGVPFGWPSFVVLWLIILALVGVWRVLYFKRAHRGDEKRAWHQAFRPAGPREGGLFEPYWLLPAAGVLTGAWMFIKRQITWIETAPLGLGNIFQGWDVQWHASVVRYIMDNGMASPSRMGELMNVESHARMLYPTAYHAVAALFGEAAGIHPIAAVNVSVIVLTGLGIPLTMASLVWVLVGNRGLVFQIGAGLAAIGIYAAPVVRWIGDYVGAWPYVVAVAITGIVVSMFVGVLHEHVTAPMAVLGFLAVVQIHPSAVTIVAVAVGLLWLLHVVWAPVKSRIQDFLWLVGPAVVGTVLYVPQLLAGSDQAEEVAGWQGDEAASRSDAWRDAVFMNTRHVDEFFANVDLTVVLILAAIGGVFLVVWRRRVWVLALYLVSVLLVVNALMPFDGPGGDVLSLIGSLHYNAAHRLVMPVAMITFAAAAIGVAGLIRLVTLAPVAERMGTTAWKVAAGALAVVVGVAAGAGTGWWATATINEQAKTLFLYPRDNDRMVNANDIEAFNWLGSRPEAYEGLTMGEPADGHSWIYAYNGVPTVARHYQWPQGGRGSDTDKLYWQAHLLGEGELGDPTAKNDIDDAAERLNVKFYLLSPWNFWHFQNVRWELLQGLWTSDGVTPVYKKGDTVIFAVKAAFTPAELEDLYRDAAAHGSDPLPDPAADNVTDTAAVEGTPVAP